MAEDQKREGEERLQGLGLRPGPESRPACMNCQSPVELTSTGAEHGMCQWCFDKD